MLKVLWAEDAKVDYWENIDYLLENFPEFVAKDFIAKTETLISLISKNNISFKLTSKQNIYQVPVVKQITIFYTIKENALIILRFWNNKKDPDTIKF